MVNLENEAEVWDAVYFLSILPSCHPLGIKIVEDWKQLRGAGLNFRKYSQGILPSLLFL
jgi:hypothetical protein